MSIYIADLKDYTQFLFKVAAYFISSSYSRLNFIPEKCNVTKLLENDFCARRNLLSKLKDCPPLTTTSHSCDTSSL